MSATTGGQAEGSGSTPAADVHDEGSKPAADENGDGMQFLGGRSDPINASWMDPSRRQGRPTNKSKVLIDHTREIPVPVQDAIVAFRPPDGFKVLASPPGAQRSII